jgi:hypothetical protein
MERRKFIRGLVGLPLVIGTACKSSPEPEPPSDLMPYAQPNPICPICQHVLAFDSRSEWYKCLLCGGCQISKKRWVSNWVAK